MQFLGLANWFKRFIPHLADMASSLYSLVSKSASWTWTTGHQQAFEQLKSALTSQSLMRFPDFSQPFVLVCDASDCQIGSVLLQQFDSALQPIYYYSHALDTQQRQYSVTEKECLAMVLSIKRFHVYLHGRFFIIRTDHRALVWLYRCKDQFSKLLRWSLFLQQYQFLIVYGKGEHNVVADALSRLSRDEKIPSTPYTSGSLLPRLTRPAFKCPWINHFRRRPRNFSNYSLFATPNRQNRPVLAMRTGSTVRFKCLAPGLRTIKVTTNAYIQWTSSTSLKALLCAQIVGSFVCKPRMNLMNALK
jgi:hypothetical protein